MTDPALLTPAELVELTGKQRHKAQARALAKMGVRFITRPDGSAIVSRALVAAMLKQYADPPPPEPHDRPIDWSAMRRPKRPKVTT